MPSQAFFTTVAGLSLSLAGFASLIAWLRVDPTAWDPINLWRVKTIVRHALMISFLALALTPVAELVESPVSRIRVGSGLLLAFALSEVLRHRRREPEIWPGRSWELFLAVNAAFVAFQGFNISRASTALLQLGYLVLLTSPAGIFYNFVHELGGAPSPDQPVEPGSPLAP